MSKIIYITCISVYVGIYVSQSFSFWGKTQLAVQPFCFLFGRKGGNLHENTFYLKNAEIEFTWTTFEFGTYTR